MLFKQSSLSRDAEALKKVLRSSRKDFGMSHMKQPSKGFVYSSSNTGDPVET